jgi:hypothetical protein
MDDMIACEARAHLLNDDRYRRRMRWRRRREAGGEVLAS